MRSPTKSRLVGPQRCGRAGLSFWGPWHCTPHPTLFKGGLQLLEIACFACSRGLWKERQGRTEPPPGGMVSSCQSAVTSPCSRQNLLNPAPKFLFWEAFPIKDFSHAVPIYAYLCQAVPSTPVYISGCQSMPTCVILCQLVLICFMRC